MLVIVTQYFFNILQLVRNGSNIKCHNFANILYIGNTTISYNYVNANHYPHMYKQMQNIKFNNLKYMNTWGNNIQSIQGIYRMYWPNLQQICLQGDNLLISLQAFRRINAPKLTWIDLKTNKIWDHSCLSEFYNQSKKFTRIHVTLYGTSAALFKVQGQVFSDISINVYKSRLGKLQPFETKRGLSVH